MYASEDLESPHEGTFLLDCLVGNANRQTNPGVLVAEPVGVLDRPFGHRARRALVRLDAFDAAGCRCPFRLRLDRLLGGSLARGVVSAPTDAFEPLDDLHGCL